MTTIAYRDGILASDSMMSGGNPAFKFAMLPKIVRAHDGTIAGAAGQSAAYGEFLSWAKHGALGCPPSGDSGEALVIRPDGSVHYWAGAACLTELSNETPYFAIGTGEKFALGAMFAGANAIGAVRAGIEFDGASGGEIQILMLDRNQEENV